MIVGPTCSGKTYLSLLLAERLDSEIISADSRQIYKKLDIGTAKPKKKDLKRIKHHFIDILNPDEEFNASRFENEAIKILENLFERNKIPIIAGGSGLYIKAVVDGIFHSVHTDEKFRKELLVLRHTYGNEYLYRKLKKVDPISASGMLSQNWKRIIRALEVYHLTGMPIWKFHEEYQRDLDVKFCQYGLQWDREKLYDNIDKRVDEMIKRGLVKETDKILKMGFNKNINSLNTVGYKEIISYLESETALDVAIELIKRNTRRYAKRQLTWFRKDKRIKWLDVGSIDDIHKSSEIILKEFN